MMTIENENRLMQFLMGLNEGYDTVKNQILMMDPFSSTNKTYSMALRVEKQKRSSKYCD